MRDHPFSRKKEEEKKRERERERKKRHFPKATPEWFRKSHKLHTGHMAADIHQISPRLVFPSTQELRSCNVKLIRCVFFAQGPPLYSFTYVSKYSCPSTRLKGSSTLNQAPRRTEILWTNTNAHFAPFSFFSFFFTQQKVTHLSTLLCKDPNLSLTIKRESVQLFYPVVKTNIIWWIRWSWLDKIAK